VKGIAGILVLYIFALIMMPCFDDPNHQDEATTNIERIFDGSHSEICSPFCSDHNCHTHITVVYVNSTFIAEQYCEPGATEITASIPTPFFAIWQPPKIG